MRPTRIASRLLAVIVVSGGGCRLFHTDTPASVRAIDAETKCPIPGAEVHLWRAGRPFEPGTVGTTGGDGVALLKYEPKPLDNVVVAASAKGYLTEESGIGDEALQASQSAPVVVELFAEPRPSIELVVPAGFTGTITVALHIRDDAPPSPKQRIFAFEVPKTGTVEVVGPPLLRHFNPDYRARYTDGAPLPERPENGSVGFWWLRTEADSELFLVGTKADYDQYWRDHPAERPKEQQPSGRGRGHGGGGRGRGGRGGMGPPTGS